MSDDDGNNAGWAALVVFVVLLYILRAVFERADQSK